MPIQSIDRKRQPTSVSALLLAASLAGIGMPAVASAATYVETTDFSNTESSPTVIGSGYNMVTGTVNNTSGNSDYADYFELTGLKANAATTVAVEGRAISGSQLYLSFLAYGTSGQNLANIEVAIPNTGAGTGSLNFTIPANGDVIFGTEVAESSGSLSYDFTLPEPSSTATAGAAAAAIATLRRKRRTAR